MNTIIKYFGITSLMASSGLFASEIFIDYARVFSTEPVYKSSKTYYPERECRIEHSHDVRHSRQNEYHHNNNTGTLAGAIVGGVLGHQVGHGRSRDIATVAGAIVGAAVANNHTNEGYKKYKNNHRYPHRHEIENCRTKTTSHYTRKLVGFDVTYKYKGEIFHTFMEKHPGKRIKVSISITPIE